MLFDIFENSKIEIIIYFFKKNNFSVIFLYSKSSFFKILASIININFLSEILLLYIKCIIK